MVEWFLELQKPWWYPGDEIWTFLNSLGAVVYTLVSITFVIGFYRIVRKQWPWSIGVWFIVNVISTFAVFPLMGNGEPAGLIRGALAITIAFISIGKICVWMYSRSKWLTATLIPYIIWLIPITALTWELVRLNAI